MVIYINSDNLSATDVDNDDAILTFTVSNVQYGQFEVETSPRNWTAMTSFNQQQIIDGDVRFIQDGSKNAPIYDMAVSDGSLSTSPVSTAITFIPSVSSSESSLASNSQQTSQISQLSTSITSQLNNASSSFFSRVNSKPSSSSSNLLGLESSSSEANDVGKNIWEIIVGAAGGGIALLGLVTSVIGFFVRRYYKNQRIEKERFIECHHNTAKLLKAMKYNHAISDESQAGLYFAELIESIEDGLRDKIKFNIEKLSPRDKRQLKEIIKDVLISALPEKHKYFCYRRLTYEEVEGLNDKMAEIVEEISERFNTFKLQELQEAQDDIELQDINVTEVKLK